MLVDLFQKRGHFTVVFRVLLLFRLDAPDFLPRFHNFNFMLADMGNPQHLHHCRHVPVLV